MRFYYLNSIASRSCPTLEMTAGKERWRAARRDGGWQEEMAAGKERWQRARRDGGRQGETAAGKERQQRQGKMAVGQGEMVAMRTAPKDMHLCTLLHTGKPSDHIPANPQCATCANYTLHTPRCFSMCHHHTRCAPRCPDLVTHDPPFLDAPRPSWTCPQPCSTSPDESQHELMCHVTHQHALAPLMCPCPSQYASWITHRVH